MEGTNVMVVLNVPAILIVLVGTLGATIAACGLEAHIRLPTLYKKAIMPDDLDLPGRVNELVGFAEKARRDGLLALDEAVNAIDDPFTSKGIQLVVDGTDPDLVAAVLDAENEAMRKRHAAARNPFMQAGALAPTMGIIGTVFGLVNVMNNLNQPEHARPADRGRVPRDADRRRLGQRRLPPDGEPPQGALRGGDALPRDDARGHPRHPGGRQPARRRGEADGLRPAEGPADRGGARRAAAAAQKQAA